MLNSLKGKKDGREGSAPSKGSGPLVRTTAPPMEGSTNTVVPSVSTAVGPSGQTTQSQLADDLYSTDGDFGIRIVSDPVDAEFDLCFIHGLTGNRETTWTHSNGTFLPILLKDSFPKARIMTYGYDTNIVGLWHNASLETFRNYGTSLATSLATTRPSSVPPHRPLYFFAHSLGGLVVKSYILSCFQPNEPCLVPLLSSTFGIIFMGTPHAGSYLASWGYRLARLLNVLWRGNHTVLDVLRRDSQFLVQLEQDFQRQLVHRLTHVRVFCFFETIAVTGVGFVVPEASATIPVYTSCGIHANHMDMTKFSGPRDPGFLLVRGELGHWMTARLVGVGVDADEGVGDRSTGKSEGGPGQPGAQTRTERVIQAASHTYSGSVAAEKVIQGDVNVAGDFKF